MALAPGENLPPEMSGLLSSTVHTFIELTIRQFKSETGLTISAEISKEKVDEVAAYLGRDLRRLERTQRGGVGISPTKIAGYFGFWIRKIKPIEGARVEDQGEQTELTNLNERVALQASLAMLKSFKKHGRDPIRGPCRATDCDGAACVERHTTAYFSFSGNLFSEYLVYSMGRRTFGPHHLCSVLDAILFASCRDPGGVSLPQRRDPV